MLGPGPWVRIHGEPEGARIYIDEQLVGTLPYRAAMTAGRYALRIESDGRIADEQDLDIPLNAGREVEVEVMLAIGEEVRASPAALAATRPAETETVAHAGDYLLGGAVAASGLLLMTVDPLRTLARDGDCADRSCQKVYGFSTRSTLQVMGGAGLVALGAVITFVVQPFAARVSVGEQSSVSFSTTF
jgi:hypothetical protein